MIPIPKIVEFYRGKLKSYGKVLECHSDKHGGDISVHEDNKNSGQQRIEVRSESGPVTELKVGTEDNQHVVAVEPAEGKKGSNFALVYVHTRGKNGRHLTSLAPSLQGCIGSGEP